MDNRNNKLLYLNRYNYNKDILNKVSEFLEKHKNLRFCQALNILNIIEYTDNWNEESSETLENLNKELDIISEKDKVASDLDLLFTEKRSDIDEFLTNLAKSDKEYKFEPQIYKLSFNEFNTFIKDRCEKNILNKFYDNYQYDDRSIIINNMYRYLWKNLIVHDIDVENEINNIFNNIELNKDISKDYLYDLHLYIISKLFNICIKLSYNDELSLNDDIYDNCVTFKFNEVPNTYYHGSAQDKDCYELTYTLTLNEQIKKIETTLIKDYDFIKEYLQELKIQKYIDKKLHNIKALRDIYNREIKNLINDIHNVCKDI